MPIGYFGANTGAAVAAMDPEVAAVESTFIQGKILPWSCWGPTGLTIFCCVNHKNINP
jgi:hypothetical protein